MAIKVQQYVAITAEAVKTSLEELAETYPNSFKHVQIIKDSGFYDMFIVYDGAASARAKATRKGGA